MNNKAKIISILAAASLLTGCGAFNTSSDEGTSTENTTASVSSASTTEEDDCCKDKDKDC